MGKVPIGSEHPVAKQTMCTTVTRDVDASVAQVNLENNNSYSLVFIKIISLDPKDRSRRSRYRASYRSRSIRS